MNVNVMEHVRKMPSNICKFCDRDLPNKEGLRGDYCIWCDVKYYRTKDKPKLEKRMIRYYGLGLYQGE